MLKVPKKKTKTEKLERLEVSMRQRKQHISDDMTNTTEPPTMSWALASRTLCKISREGYVTRERERDVNHVRKIQRDVNVTRVTF